MNSDSSGLTLFTERDSWKDSKKRAKWAKTVFAPLIKQTKDTFGIELPFKFVPRPYQVDIVHAMLTKQFVAFCLHRRAGKDYMSISMLVFKAMEKVGNYCYLFPTAKQGREVIWQGIDNDGMKFLDHIPAELIATNSKNNLPMVNNVDMRITLVNGSTIQLVGSDNYDRTLVGTNMAGIIFSEYSLSDPRAWEYSMPIVIANGGWAWFNGTPRGKNHFYKLLKAALDPETTTKRWFACIKGNNDTKVLSADDINEMRVSMSEQRIDQEVNCAFEGCIEGKIYMEQIKDAMSQGRFGDFGFDRTCPVYISFDLGAGDRTAMVFFQQRGDRPWVIDFYSAKGMGVKHYKMIADDYAAKYGYKYETVFIPHDARKRSIDNYDDEGFALRTEDTFRREFVGCNIMLVPRCNDINEDIEAVRGKFHRWYFYEGTEKDKAQKERLDFFYNAMNEYTYPETDDQKNIAMKPLHNWCSDPMDAYRYAVKAQSFGWCGAKARTWLSDLDVDHSISSEENEDEYAQLI